MIISLAPLILCTMNACMAESIRETGKLWELSERVLGACMEVHRHLGPGLLESAYEQCLSRELWLMGLGFTRQRPVPLTYKGLSIDCAYRLDVVVQEKLLVEVKAVNHLLPIHEAQVITYLKLTGLDVGLLINFNTPVLRSGIRRLVRRGAESGLLAEERPEHVPTSL